MAYAASFTCTRCGEECEFRAANFADSGLCDECYAAQPDVGLCECCGELSDSRAFATPDDWNSPLWCEACREASACLYCGAQMSEDEGPHCGACFAAMYGPTDGGAA